MPLWLSHSARTPFPCLLLRPAMPETGVVAKWLNHKGIGFITPDKGGEDYLVHYSEISGDAEQFRSLAEGEKVEYELKPDPKNDAKMIAARSRGLAAET